MKKFLYILALCSFLSSCQEQDLKDPSLVIAEDGFVAYKADQVKHGSRTVGPNSYFPIGTYYYLWSYKPATDTTQADFSQKIFVNDSKYNRGLPPLGKESQSHYVEVASDNKKLLNGNQHIFGFCINGDATHSPYGLSDLEDLSAADNNSDTQATKSIYTIGKSNITANSWDYLDYCRGHVHYDPEMDVYATASSFTIPFTHVMSQLRVSVVQEGQTHYNEQQDDNGNTVFVADGRDDYDIKLKSLKIVNEHTSFTFDAINNAYSRISGKKEGPDSLTNGRVIWESAENEGMGRHIPDLNNDTVATNIQTTTLIVPQGPKPTTKADPENPGSTITIDYSKEDFTGVETSNTVYLELVITGADAWKFDNQHQASMPGEGNEVTVWIPLVLNRTGDTSNDKDPDPLRFLPNHAYNLVVSFHGDNIQVVTLKAQIYPWFDGETEAGEPGDMYQTSDIGSPMVFGNVQWNDRYMGSDWVAPTNLEQFVKATGFYYQKDRSIPFYPTTYVGGYVYDLNGDDYDLSYVEGKLGTSHSITAFDDTYEKYYNRVGSGVQGIWANRKTMHRTYTTGGQVFFRAGGHWEDPTAAQMMNDLPVVHPVVSYYLPAEQIEIPGLNTPGNDSYFAYVEDYHAYGTSGDYCCTVDDYYDKATGKINTFTAIESSDGNYKGDITYEGNRIMRFVSDMRDVTSGTWADVNKQPCPPGWRLPTDVELFTIFPSTPLAGNFTFLEDFRINDGSVGGQYGGGKDDSWGDIDKTYLKYHADGETFEVKEAYVRIPYREDRPNEDLYPPLKSNNQRNYGNNESQSPEFIGENQGNHYNNKPINFPQYDPEPGDVTQYVISKRHFTEEEFNDAKSLSATDKAKIPGATEEAKKALYIKYAGKNLYGSPVPEANLPADGKHAKYVDREWGTIYAIKKQGSPDAYRMRWRVVRVQENYDMYQIVVDKYKCSQDDKLEYDFSHMGQKDYYLEYDWDHPESSLYFPVTGIIADHDMSQYNKDSNGNYLGGPRLYNYGTETIILTSSFTDFYSNPNASDPNDRGYKRYAAAYRIKVTGTDSYCMYLYPSMERLAQGGQVRPVRTAR